MGVDTLHTLYENCAELQSLIRSVTYLIRGAIFRLSHSSSASIPEGICPLGELLDMYHTHEATKRHDKIYALLGMSSDKSERAELIPNYQEPWENVLQHLAKSLFSNKLLVETQPSKEAVMFKGRGCILGKIVAVDKDTGWTDRQILRVAWKDVATQQQQHPSWTGTRWTIQGTRWTIQESAKPVHKDDLVCILEGAARPTIIRLQQDFSIIIVISAQPPSFSLKGDDIFEERERQGSTEVYIRDFTLVWEWCDSSEHLQHLGQLKVWVQSNNWRPVNASQRTEARIEEANRYWNNGLVWGDVEEYDAAEELFKIALRSYEMCLNDRDWDATIVESNYEVAKNFLHFKGEHNRYIMHSRRGWTPFLGATKEGHDKIADYIRREGLPDANHTDEHNRPLLLGAAERGEVKFVEKLIRYGAYVNAVTSSSGPRTALEAAAKSGHLDVLEQLLEAMAVVDVEADYCNGRTGTALQAAAEQGHVAIVERLIKAGAKVNAQAGRLRGRTAIQAAAEGGHLAVVEQLLEAEADVNVGAKYTSGRTALQAAAEKGHIAIVERLIKAKANINAPAGVSGGRTALQAAAEGGHLHVVERLLRAKADVNAPAAIRHGITAIRAAENGGHSAVVECLRRAGAVVSL